MKPVLFSSAPEAVNVVSHIGGIATWTLATFGGVADDSKFGCVPHCSAAFSLLQQGIKATFTFR
jgi:hypothetical protein